MKIEINLTEYEEKIMKDIVVSIEDWFLKGPFKEKIANHENRIKKLMLEKLTKENKPLPKNGEELIEMYFSSPNYKTRKQKYQEAKIEDLKKNK